MSRYSRYRRLVAVVAVIDLTIAGCSRPREFSEVEGAVTLNGKGIARIEVLFLPDPERQNKGNTSTGFTDPQGRYRLRNDRDEKDGTVLGMHRVLLIDSDANKDPTGMSNRPSRIPTSYAEASKTPLRDIDVKSGKQTFDFELKTD